MFLRRALTFIILFTISNPSLAQNPCETTITASIQRLPELLIKNNFDQLQSISNTIQSSCTKNELALRLEILIQIIQKENSNNSIQKYLEGQYDDILVNRYDDASLKNYKSLFKENPEKYQYLPLNSSIDSLIQIKARALLNANRYTLNSEELAITYLFADYIDDFYQELNKQPKQRLAIDKIRDHDFYKNKMGYEIHLGTFIPFKSQGYFSTSAMLGFNIQGPLNKKFVPEINYKLRILDNGNLLNIHYENEDFTINAQTTHSISLGLGYKIYDSGKFILLPKINSGVGFIWTGISETYYSEDEFGNEIENQSYKNINTWQNAIGISALWHLNKKLFLGLETKYHNAPYNWDKKLISTVQQNFLSIELFLRF